MKPFVARLVAAAVVLVPVLAQATAEPGAEPLHTTLKPKKTLTPPPRSTHLPVKLPKGQNTVGNGAGTDVKKVPIAELPRGVDPMPKTHEEPLGTAGVVHETAPIKATTP